MPEIEPLSSFPFPSPASFEPADREESAGFLADAPAVGSREGLPSTYRMRHDSHYVDQLIPDAGGRVEREIARVADRDRREPAPVDLAILAPAILRVLTEALDSMTSCMNLLPAADRSLRERVAIGLMQAEIDRASLLALAAQVLSDDRILEDRRIELGALLRQIVTGLEPANRLAGTMVGLHCESEGAVKGDRRLLSIAFAGAIGALQVLGTHVGEPLVTARISAMPNSMVVELDVRGVRLPESKRAEVLELSWFDRPGGFGAALALNAARRIARAQGGRLEQTTQESGFGLAFTFPRV